MPQSLASLPVHFVFSTKQRTPWLRDGMLPRLFEYVGGTVRSQGWVLLAAGGMPDHVHLLISLSRDSALADAMRVVKSNSSRWLSDAVPDLAGFSWQGGYGAFAVSHSQIEGVVRYIDRQAEHHADVTFQDEYRAILTRHGLAWDERHVWD